MKYENSDGILSLEVSPTLFLIFFIVWTLFIYTIGSLFYDCQCKLVNLKNTVSYTGCAASYDEDMYYKGLDAYVTELNVSEGFLK